MRWFVVGLWAATGCNGDKDGTSDQDTDDPTETSDTSSTTPETVYEATVRTTSYGVPHILADDMGSLGFGTGWAAARDHLCTLADQFVIVRSERARYFGPGDRDANIDADFGWLGLGIMERAQATFSTLQEDEQATIQGYAAGYNHYLQTTPEAEIDPRCRGEAWVTPISDVELFAYYLRLGQRGSGINLLEEVGNAQPPPPRSSAQGTTAPPPDRAPPPPIEVLQPFLEPPIGSNGWAIGSDRSASGRGMLLSNTHFPSQGELQWWEMHQTIPGELNVYGAGLLGSAIPNLGFNENVAWTHTVSGTPRFIVVALTINPKQPTQYLYEDKWVDMTSKTHEIQVLQENGSLQTMRRTLYATQWGPMFNAPVVGWTQTIGFTWRDVNAENVNLISVFRRMGLASTQAEFEAAHRETQGIPWVHTMFADDQGTALYVDSAATPNLSEQAVAAYQTFLKTNGAAQLFGGFGLIVVDGNDPIYNWVEDARSSLPGAVPYDEAPRLQRTDFVNNANMNHWMSNPMEPLEGYPWLYGPTGAPLLPRTKMNNRYLMEKNGASGADYLFDLDELESAALSARAAIAEDLLAQVVARCTGAGPVTVRLDDANYEDVDISEACAILSKWDGRSRTDSVGAHVWREAVLSELNEEIDILDSGRLYGDAFDPANPIFTPSTLAPATKDGDPVLEGLAAAVVRLGQAGVALDATLGSVQYGLRDGEKYARLGGQYAEGLIAISTYGGGNSMMLPFDRPPQPIYNDNTDLAKGGYYVNNGNSWVMAMEFTDDGPNARAILVYSQSDNPESAHFEDQTALYANESRMRPILFTEEQIAADPNLEVVELTNAP
ncbi:MAG: penicillin acylase family protein [Myxococcales bacterium]|nr:penicillin acylase family protein [Myxococcales bacterium]